MKQNKIVLISVLFLLLTNYFCQVEELEPISLVKGSLETTKKVSPAFFKHDLSSYKIIPIWKSAITFENTEAVEVNFTLDKKTYKPLSKNGKISGRQRLLLTFEKGKIRETIIEYIPSDDFMGDIKEINSGNFKSKQFDGEVSFKNPKDNYSMVWVLSKGVVSKKLKRTESSTKQKKINTTARLSEVCNIREILYEICVGPGGEEVCSLHLKTVLECEWIDEPDYETLPEVDPFDCNVDPSWPWCQDGGGNGGENPPPPIDPPSNPCENLRAVFDDTNPENIKSQIDWLKGKVNAPTNNLEHAVEVQKRMNPDETYRYEYTQVSSTNEFSVEISTGSTYIGSIHSHPENGYDMFSFQDIKTLLATYDNASSTRARDVFLSIVVEDNTTGEALIYTLQIDQVAMLRSEVNAVWNDPKYSGFSDNEKIEAIHVEQAQKYKKSNNQLEKSFLEQFNNYGISLFKGGNTLNNWDKLTLNQSTVTKNPCQ